jgi:hypothetical protein
MTYPKHDKTTKHPKHRFFHKRAQQTKKRGAGWFPWGNSNGDSKVKAVMNYPLCKLQLDGRVIPCEVCKTDIYYIISVSMDRSKTAAIITDIFIATEANQILAHPYKSYVCHTCLHTRLIYQPTTWNGLQQRILEVSADFSPPGEAPAPVVAPAQAPLQVQAPVAQAPVAPVAPVAP